MILVALVLAALLCPHAWAAGDPSAFAYVQRPGNQVPLTALFKDERGDSVTLGQVIGHRPSILALGYFRCPNLCGLVRNDLIHALSGLEAGRRYGLVVLSIDPSETSADARSARDADIGRFDHPEATEDWRYLTGSASEIRSVAAAVGFRSRFDPDVKQFLHPAGLVFLTGSGEVSGYLLGLGYQASDVGLGLTRAANGITARALPILLLCFHYDKSTGRYTLAVTRVLQLGAGITVLVVGGTITLALRRERGSR